MGSATSSVCSRAMRFRALLLKSKRFEMRSFARGFDETRDVVLARRWTCCAE